jgi:Beta protein
MFDHKHYVPVLKAKEGEFWALEHLNKSTADCITPIIEIPPYKPKKGDTGTFKSNSEGKMKLLKDIWGSRRFFLDTHFVKSKSTTPSAAIRVVFAAANRFGLMAIPTMAITDSTSYLAAVKEIVDHDKRGVMIRLRGSEFDTDGLSSRLSGLINNVGVDRSNVDILIDYSNYPVDSMLKRLPLAITQLPDVKHWRTLIFSGGSLLPALPEESLKRWIHIRREEWVAWYGTVVNTGGLPRKPSYSDYGIRDSGPPPSGGRASANLRYTTNEYIFVRKGRQVAEGYAGDVRDFAKVLVVMKEFEGENFSAGDGEIVRISKAADGESVGAGREWLQWCMNHHLEFVVKQIAKHSEL